MALMITDGSIPTVMSPNRNAEPGHLSGRKNLRNRPLMCTEYVGHFDEPQCIPRSALCRASGGSPACRKP